MTSRTLSTFLLCFSTPIFSPSRCHLPRPSNYSNERLRAEEEEAEREEAEEAARVGEGRMDGSRRFITAFCLRRSSSDPALIGPRRLTADVRTWSAVGADVGQVVMRRSEGAARLTISSFSKHEIPIMQEVIGS